MATKCDQCGVESEIELAYRKERRWFGLQTRRYCPACLQKRHTQALKRSLLFFILFGIAGLALVLVNPGNWLGWILLKLVLFLLLSVPLILVHELAHALAGYLLKLRIFAIFIGYGKTLFARRALGINWEIKTFPFGGLTIIGSPPLSYYRFRMFLTLLAGPAVHGLLFFPLIAVPVILSIFGQAASVAGSMFEVMAWANAIIFLISLFPIKSMSVYGETGSDGWNLLRIPFLASNEIQDHYASYYVQEAVDAYRQGDLRSAKVWIEKGIAQYPAHPLVLNGLGFILLEAREFARARNTFANLLQSHPDMKPELKFMVQNNIAYANLMVGDPALLAEADTLSAQAYKNAPWMPSIVGTRGAVLVELGQLDEGIAMLKEAMANQSEVQGKAADACLIAIGEIRKGNLVESQRFLDLARSLDPNCYLIERAAAELPS